MISHVSAHTLVTCVSKSSLESGSHVKSRRRRRRRRLIILQILVEENMCSGDELFPHIKKIDERGEIQRIFQNFRWLLRLNGKSWWALYSPPIIIIIITRTGEIPNFRSRSELISHAVALFGFEALIGYFLHIRPFNGAGFDKNKCVGDWLFPQIMHSK